MKQDYVETDEGNEFDILSKSLDPNELSILNYLKKFKRKNKKGKFYFSRKNKRSEKF